MAILEKIKDVNRLVVDERDISFDGLSLYHSSSDEEECYLKSLDIPAAFASSKPFAGGLFYSFPVAAFSDLRKYCLEPVAPAFGAASEATTCEGKEQISPRKKKLNFC